MEPLSKFAELGVGFYVKKAFRITVMAQWCTYRMNKNMRQFGVAHEI